MSVPANLGEKQGVHDKEVQARFGGANGAATESAAQETAEEKCRKLSEECERLRTELAEVRKERDIYSKMVGTLSAQYEPIPTDEEILACLGQKPSFEELIDELETEMAAKESGHA